MAPLPNVATKAPGITVETIEEVDSVVVDFEGDPLGEVFEGFAVDSIRDPEENELTRTPQAGCLVFHEKGLHFPQP